MKLKAINEKLRGVGLARGSVSGWSDNFKRNYQRTIKSVLFPALLSVGINPIDYVEDPSYVQTNERTKLRKMLDKALKEKGEKDKIEQLNKERSDRIEKAQIDLENDNPELLDKLAEKAFNISDTEEREEWWDTVLSNIADRY